MEDHDVFGPVTDLFNQGVLPADQAREFVDKLKGEPVLEPEWTSNDPNTGASRIRCPGCKQEFELLFGASGASRIPIKAPCCGASLVVALRTRIEHQVGLRISEAE